MKIEGIMEKNMRRIEATSPEAQSGDIMADNIDQLKALFPGLITEGASGVSVNVDALKALVGDGSDLLRRTIGSKFVTRLQ